jgi:serine protease Do
MGLDHGVIISEVHKGGPAEKAGIKGDDIIVALNDKPVKDGDDLMGRVADMPVGTPALLSVDRDGKKMDFKLVVQDRLKVFADDERVAGKVDMPATAVEDKPEVSKLVQFGVQLRALTDDERNLTTEKRGLFVARVEPGSFASEIGMQERDIITAVGRQPVNAVEDVKKVQSKLKPGDPVAFRVVRAIPAGLRGRTAATSPSTVTVLLSGTLPE